MLVFSLSCALTCCIGSTLRATTAFAQTAHASYGTTDVVILAEEQQVDNETHDAGALAQTGTIDPVFFGVFAAVCGAGCIAIEWILWK